MNEIPAIGQRWLYDEGTRILIVEIVSKDSGRIVQAKKLLLKDDAYARDTIHKLSSFSLKPLFASTTILDNQSWIWELLPGQDK